MRIGVDAGGTFTDFIVLHGDGRLETFKLRSNPGNPAQVILEGIARAAGRSKPEVVHGSTVATNALLERKGVRTAFVTTAGFEDLLEIGRQNRAQLYNLTPPPRRLLAPPELCFGVTERTLQDGSIASKPQNLKRLMRELRRAKVRSVAVCLLNSYRNPDNERAVAEALEGPWYLSASCDISPEFREFERASTTVINAYIGPLMDAYLADLASKSALKISIMQSNGGVLSTSQARKEAVRTVLSGPAGGVIGARTAAAASGFHRILGFDMGGTSTDVCLVDGEPQETTETYIDGMPIRVPMLDIHTVGAGGGSIARVDRGGLLRVGPESAGAAPGPACYGTGDQPTVTDAHVVLGRLETLLGGSMTLDRDRAAAAVERVGRESGLSLSEAAAGILRVANANMESAIRVVSVERGHDPRDFALVAFGGSGGLHACEIAGELGISTVIAPEHAGVLSALGMLAADKIRDYSAGCPGQADFERSFRILAKRARADLRGAILERSADLRYLGQSYEIRVPWNRDHPALPFHAAHQRAYGYATPEREVEVVTLRVRARIPVKKPEFRACLTRTRAVPRRRVYIGGAWADIPVYGRDAFGNRRRPGPALVLDYGSTVVVPPGWWAKLDAAGNLILVREGNPGR
ncbi:MAG: hydantoinase/oxoprolinase family protein [Bryobacteraceae bacterium]|nr:hydantoinase/oxoprolinase family protein [Bryobacteraceae bacterium]